MKKVGVAILGLGVVGSGTYKILTEKRDYFKATQDIDLTVESVLEINKQRALDLGIEESIISSNIAEVISNPNVDIVVEVIGGIEPARTFLLAALKSGKSVVTSNKELFSKHWHELEKAAKEMDAGLYFEASCVGGVPIIRTLTDSMQANYVTKLTGIINGTTNFILTKMHSEGVSYQEVLKEAQSLGYAEANPTADVEGYDAAYKLSILSSLAFHTKIPVEKVYREGITKITAEDINYGKQLGLTIKLLGIARSTDSGIEVRVHPTFIKDSHPLASVKDSFNAVFLEGDSVGDIMLYGRGAGALPTGSAIVSDVIYAATHTESKYSTFKNNEQADSQTKFVSDFETGYFLRFTVADKPGVLSKIAGIFGKYNVSITDVIQKGTAGGLVPLIFITHKTREFSVQKALEKIKQLEEIVAIDTMIRVED